MNGASKVIQHLRRSVLLHDGAGLPDGKLLECFIERRDEAAFAALVKRHAPMVWGVCHRLLNHHDAEDAFQATFLVLIRKAASIKPREMVGNWLYGVAHQTALQARRTAARRRAKEKQVTEMPEREAVQQKMCDDLLALLDQELSRLPDKYRAVIVLCDLEGKTRKETALQLGCPEGTVAGRLARARSLLAKRLSRYGLVVSGEALAGMLYQQAASAAVPNLALSSSIKAVSLFAAGQAAISVEVAVLTEGVLKIMLLNKLKITSLTLLMLMVGLTTGGIVYRTQAADTPIALRATERAGEKKVEVREKKRATEKVGEKKVEVREKKIKADFPVVKLVKSPEISIDFTVSKVGPSGLGNANVYMTLDKGQTWTKMPGKVPVRLSRNADSDDQEVTGSVSVQLPAEGTIYGFIVAVKSKAGLAPPAPKPGDPPEVLVELDTTAPKGQLFRPGPHPTQPNTLLLAWKVEDRNLGDKPVMLEWAEQKDGPWNTIGEAALPNTGRYPWRLPERLPPRFYLRLTMRDLAGNVSRAQTDKPELIDFSVPQTKVIGVSPGSRKSSQRTDDPLHR